MANCGLREGAEAGALRGMQKRLRRAHPVLLIAIHLYLVRRYGVAPVPGDELQPKKKFYPQQVAKDTIAIFGWFAVLMGMAQSLAKPFRQPQYRLDVGCFL